MDPKDPRAKQLKQFKRTLKRLSAQFETLFGHEGARPDQQSLLAMQQSFGAQHYQREQGFILDHADGCFVWDMAGKKYLDCIALYSAIASGHGNVELIGAMMHQSLRMSGAPNRLINDMQPQLLQRIAELTHQDGVLLMNTGAEAVDTAVKAARRWFYRVKHHGDKHFANKAEIISANGNFHGRTLNATALSGTAKYREDFGPFSEGYVKVAYGDIDALKQAINPNTAAFIVEPIQGEGGIILPPNGYLPAIRKLCTEANVLLIYDEIQTGLGRTGLLFGGDWGGEKPDGVLLGKALGQYVPVSAFAARQDVIDMFTPGSHGSTFGGTALSCAVALKSLELITRDEFALVRNSMTQGIYFRDQLRALRSPAIAEIRGHGLFIGMEINPQVATPDAICAKLFANGIIAGVAQQTVRFTPPLVITKEEVDWAIPRIVEALS
jgi:ornithine--oxo-acid transaminase